MSAGQLVIAVAATAVLIAVLTLVARQMMFAFEIRIADGRALLRHGRPRAGFVPDVQEIAARNGVRRGKVRGVGSGRAMRLSFAGVISDEARQQMRNAWSLLR